MSKKQKTIEQLDSEIAAASEKLSKLKEQKKLLAAAKRKEDNEHAKTACQIIGNEVCNAFESGWLEVDFGKLFSIIGENKEVFRAATAPVAAPETAWSRLLLATSGERPEKN